VGRSVVVEPTPPAEGASPAGRPTRRVSERILRVVSAPSFLVYAALVWAYLLFRLGSYPRNVVACGDTATYEHVAGLALSSWRFWAGERGFTVPLFLKLFHTPNWRGDAQLAFSICSWLALAAATARCVRVGWLRVAAFAAVLAFSLTTAIVLWDAILMSESLTLSLTALLLAAWLELVRSPRPLWAGVVLAVSVLWVFARDTNAYVVLVVAALVALTLIRGNHRRLKVALAVGCGAIFALGYGSAEAGTRWLQPMRDVVTHRVLLDRSLRTYFVARGLDPQSNYPESAWMRHDARSVYLRYLVTHPGYTLAGPFHGRQQTLFSTPGNAASLLDPNVGPCSGDLDAQFLPFPRALQRVVFPHGVALVIGLTLATLAAAALVFRVAGAERIWLVPLGVLVTTYPHFLAVWHLSGLEVDRHAFEATLLLRLAVLLLIVFVLDRALGIVKSRRGPASSDTPG
jgi:hypothetical protein